MTIEDLALKWVIWTLMISLILGGKPWKFPGGGNAWLESVFYGSASK